MLNTIQISIFKPQNRNLMKETQDQKPVPQKTKEENNEQQTEKPTPPQKVSISDPTQTLSQNQNQMIQKLNQLSLSDKKNDARSEGDSHSQIQSPGQNKQGQIFKSAQNEEKSKTTIEEKSQTKQQNNAELRKTSYYIETSRKEIVFGRGVLCPGAIEEFDLAIQLKEQRIPEAQSKVQKMLRVIARCQDAQFDNLDEYVFSVRSNDRFDYFQEVRYKIKMKEKALVKVAIKVPSVMQDKLISGSLEIQLSQLEPMFFPIKANCQIPQIVCVKNLFNVGENIHIIKVPAKKNQHRMPPIPFKNNSNFNLAFEVDAITSESFASKPYDIVPQNFANAPANTQFIINFQLRENNNYKEKPIFSCTIRKILILKIKNSSLFYNFPLQVTVFEGNAASGGMN